MQPAPERSALSPLLLLCPLLAVSDSLLNALGLSVVAMLVTLIASVPMTLTLQRLPEYGRIAAVVVLAAGVVTCALLLTHAFAYDLYLAVGAYVPLLVAGGLMIARNDVVTPREQRRALILAGLRTGAAFSSMLIALGVARELVGHGSLFFGAPRLHWQIFTTDLGFVLALLPPGAFMAMGFLFAARNWVLHTRTRARS